MPYEVGGNKNRQDECRERGVRHCRETTCEYFISCPMSVDVERSEARHGDTSLWQVPLYRIESQTESKPLKPAQTTSKPIKPCEPLDPSQIVQGYSTPTKSKKKDE